MNNETIIEVGFHISGVVTQPPSIVIVNYTSKVLDFTLEVKNLSKFRFVS